MFLTIKAAYDWLVLRIFLWAACRVGWPVHSLYAPDGEDGDVKAWICADSDETINLLLSGKTWEE